MTIATKTNRSYHGSGADQWLASMAGSELAIASMIGSVADKIDQLKVSDSPDELKFCIELRQMVTEVLNLTTERHKWIFQTINMLMK